MLKLVVVAPDKRKVELDCDPSLTFQQVKEHLETQLGVPPDKQRLLCNGKERKNGAETLAAAGVGAKSKMMLMLVPGYTMPPAPAAATADDGSAAAATGGGEDGAEAADTAGVDLEGELPLPPGTEAAAAVGDAGVAVVHVRQGRNRYHVRVRQGLASATFGELADCLSAHMLPAGVPASECRLICKGKTAERSDPLCAAGGAEMTVMLLFREGFHVANEGADWLRERSAELQEAEAKIERLGKRIEANFSDQETSLRLAEVGGLVETLKQSVEIVRVRENKLEEMRAFRDRVLAADARLEVLRKGVRL